MSLPTKLLTEMATHGPTATILNKVLDSLNRQKIDIRTYFTDPTSPMIIRDWHNRSDIQDWIDRVEGARQEGTAQRGLIYNGMSDGDECAAAIELMDPHFKKHHFGKGGLRIYHVKDAEQRLLAPIERNDDEEFTITSVLKPRLQELNCILNVRKIKNMKDWWLGYGNDIPRPKLCAQPEEDVWCQWRIPVHPDCGAVDTFHDGLSEQEALEHLRATAPATYGFFGRLSDAPALAAFHWGVTSGEYEGRQIPWVQGEGQDGKSKWMKAFSDVIFGGTQGVATVIQNSTLKNSAQFVAGLLVNKRFAYVPDNSNRRLLMGEVFKSLADPGADPVVVNHKYGKMYTSELEAHVAILSNHLPEITGEKWMTTRLLLLTIAPLPKGTIPDTRIDQKFKEEMPIFLAYARYCYRRRCVQNAIIESNEFTSELVASLIEDAGAPWSVRFEKCFVLDPNATITPNEVYEVLTSEARCNQYDVTEFKTWLSEHMKGRVTLTRSKGAPRVYCGMRRRLEAESNVRTQVNIPFGDQGFNGLDDQEGEAA